MTGPDGCLAPGPRPGCRTFRGAGTPSTGEGPSMLPLRLAAAPDGSVVLAVGGAGALMAFARAN